MSIDRRVDVRVSELAKLACDAYKVNSADCSRVGDDWWPWDEYGQRYSSTSQVGFYARMYYSPTRQALIATFRGTTGETGRKDTVFEKVAHYADMAHDIVTDVLQFGSGFSVSTLQAETAIKFIEGSAYLKKNGYKLIGCTGHSLGGGLAHVCAINFGIPAVGFNPAPHDSFGGVNVNSQKNLRFVHSYVSENDPVSNLSILAALTDNRGLGPANGAVVVKGARGGHSMDKLAEHLQAAPEGKQQPFAWTPGS